MEHYVFTFIIFLNFCLQVKLLLQQSNIDVNRRNNDRLTSFMLAMQGGPLIGPIDTSWSGWESCNNTHDKLRRLMDLPASIGKKHAPKK